MVLPLIAALIAGGATVWGAEKLGIIDAGDAGSAIGNIAGEAVGAIIEIIPSAMPELVDAVGRSVVTTREALRGREVAFTTGITVVTLVVTTYWGVRSLFRVKII